MDAGANLSAEQRQQLTTLYFSPDQPGSLTGSAEQFFQLAKRHVPTITRQQITYFLNGVAAYTLHRQASTKPRYNKLQVARCFELLHVDIMIARRYVETSDETIYMWIVIVDAHSRYIWVLDLRNRTAVECTRVMRTYLESVKDRLFHTVGRTHHFLNEKTLAGDASRQGDGISQQPVQGTAQRIRCDAVIGADAAKGFSRRVSPSKRATYWAQLHLIQQPESLLHLTALDSKYQESTFSIPVMESRREFIARYSSNYAGAQRHAEAVAGHPTSCVSQQQTGRDGRRLAQQSTSAQGWWSPTGGYLPEEHAADRSVCSHSAAQRHRASLFKRGRYLTTSR